MYAPSDEKRYKVYIIDEAHMLTREAWNALLKILEEPPPRVIFVFATTEPQKIRQSASPVLSRVQRFDFRRVSVSDLVARLAQVLELEGVTADADALLPIARRAEGGVRDALSLLDQVLSFSGDRVSAEDVRKMLGLVEEERFIELLDIVHAGDRAAVFPFVQALLDEGYDLAEFVQGLGDTLRAVLALRLDPDADATELSSEARASLATAGERFSADDLLRLLVATADFESAGRFRRSAQPRIQVEVLLLRLASLDSSVELAELLDMLGAADGSAAGRQPRPARSKSPPRKRSVPSGKKGNEGISAVEADPGPRSGPPSDHDQEPVTVESAEDESAEERGGRGTRGRRALQRTAHGCPAGVGGVARGGQGISASREAGGAAWSHGLRVRGRGTCPRDPGRTCGGPREVPGRCRPLGGFAQGAWGPTGN